MDILLGIVIGAALVGLAGQVKYAVCYWRGQAATATAKSGSQSEDVGTEPEEQSESKPAVTNLDLYVLSPAEMRDDAPDWHESERGKTNAEIHAGFRVEE